MDLLECPYCTACYVACCAGSGSGWICRHCHRELRVRGRAPRLARRPPAGRRPAGRVHRARSPFLLRPSADGEAGERA